MGNTTGKGFDAAPEATALPTGKIRSRLLGLKGSKRRAKYRTAEELCKQIIFEHPSLKSVISTQNVPGATPENKVKGSIVVADVYASQDQAIIWVSDGFELLTLYSREDVLGTNCRFLQGEGTSPDDIASLRTAIQNGEEIEIEVLNYRKDGAAFWNHLRLYPIHGPGKTSGTIYNYVAFAENARLVPDLGPKGNIYEWNYREVEVWLRKHKYGLYAKTLNTKKITGEQLAGMSKKQLKAILAAGTKDAFMRSVLSTDCDAIYALIRKQKSKHTPGQLCLSSPLNLPLPPAPSTVSTTQTQTGAVRTSSSSSVSGEGSEVEMDFDREKSETEMDARRKRDSWLDVSSDSTDSTDSDVIQGRAIFAGGKEEQKHSQDKLGLITLSSGKVPLVEQVAFKYFYEDREAVVLLVPTWVTLSEFKKRVATQCGVSGWALDMTFKVRNAKDSARRDESGSFSSRSFNGDAMKTRSISEELQSPRGRSAAEGQEKKSVLMIESEDAWKRLLSEAKGTIQVYCSRPTVISQVRCETDNQPGVP